MIVANLNGPLVDGDVIPDYAWLKRTMRIPDARFFSTTSYELLADAVDEACEDLGITIAYGNPGAGKTFALRVAILNRCRLPVTWFETTHCETPFRMSSWASATLAPAVTDLTRKTH